ncbi:hypothetical protein [Nocardia grenadensis]|uniref:hypothetical protein n=1 Tax=Nocardia grenadensis TaxID=931537 RepID=UPI003D7608EA
MTASLRRMDDQLGGGTLLAMVRAHLGHVLRLLRDGSYDDSTGRRLHASAAELLRLAGRLCFDTSQHAHAQRYWVTALRTAHSAGDRALTANILGFMSCQAKDLGQAREATLLADTAIAGYPGASARVSAILHLRAAEAHAVTGSTTDTRRAIDAAFTHLDSPTGAAPDWSYWLDLTHAHTAKPDIATCASANTPTLCAPAWSQMRSIWLWLAGNRSRE